MLTRDTGNGLSTGVVFVYAVTFRDLCPLSFIFTLSISHALSTRTFSFPPFLPNHTIRFSGVTLFLLLFARRHSSGANRFVYRRVRYLPLLQFLLLFTGFRLSSRFPWLSIAHTTECRTRIPRERYSSFTFVLT